MKNQEAFIAKINAVNPGCYWAGISELDAIKAETGGAILDAMCLAFQYGFLRGQNAEKNKRRKKKS